MQVIRTEEINTNNAWGFGGKIATVKTFDNGVVRVEGRNYHRHTGTSSANAWRVRLFEDFEIEVHGNANTNQIHVYHHKRYGCYRAFFTPQDKPFDYGYDDEVELFKVFDFNPKALG
jgi:hypothetical protein